MEVVGRRAQNNEVIRASLVTPTTGAESAGRQECTTSCGRLTDSGARPPVGLRGRRGVVRLGTGDHGTTDRSVILLLPESSPVWLSGTTSWSSQPVTSHSPFLSRRKTATISPRTESVPEMPL